MTAENYRDSFHDILGECFLYHGEKNQQRMFVFGYLKGVYDCIVNDNSIFCDDEDYLHLTWEYDYIRESIIAWINAGLDVRTEIDRVGWNDRKMVNAWWYEHG
ncbi:MAG: hypothetical protein IIZ08_08495 [Clostridia bacterium]|nr:hypothetical protein [Clostridia bacterium]